MGLLHLYGRVEDSVVARGRVGGDIVTGGLAPSAIGHGGYVRVGLEDHDGPREPRNEDLVREVVALAEAAGVPWPLPRKPPRYSIYRSDGVVEAKIALDPGLLSQQIQSLPQLSLGIRRSA